MEKMNYMEIQKLAQETAAIYRRKQTKMEHQPNISWEFLNGMPSWRLRLLKDSLKRMILEEKEILLALPEKFTPTPPPVFKGEVPQGMTPVTVDMKMYQAHGELWVRNKNGELKKVHSQKFAQEPQALQKQNIMVTDSVEGVFWYLSRNPFATLPSIEEVKKIFE